MNFKDILVHIDNRTTCPGRLDVAISLARQQGARLTGVYVVTHPYFGRRDKEGEDLEQQAKSSFEQALATSGVEGEWISVDSVQTGLDVVQAVNLYAHYRDLVVVSQTDRDSTDRSIPADLPERAVLGSGRPVLIVPYAGTFPVMGKRIMMAWRGGPESSRALHDAMPLLRKAECVSITSVQGPGGDEAYELHNADIAEHLQRYNIGATNRKLISGGLSVGDMLLNRCADEGFDLLVMGAFSQSRRGSQTLGEVGRYLLSCMTIPVLMSH